MANRVYVLGRSPEPISFQEISEQIQDMGFLDKPVQLDLSPSRANGEWVAFEVHREDIEPIAFEQLREPDELRIVVSEVCEKLEREDESDITRSLLQRLSDVLGGLLIHLPADLPEDVWEMLDACEGYFAEICDGVIVAHEGMFDSSLNLLLAWRDPGVLTCSGCAEVPPSYDAAHGAKDFVRADLGVGQVG